MRSLVERTRCCGLSGSLEMFLNRVCTVSVWGRVDFLLRVATSGRSLLLSAAEWLGATKVPQRLGSNERLCFRLARARLDDLSGNRSWVCRAGPRLRAHQDRRDHLSAKLGGTHDDKIEDTQSTGDNFAVTKSE